MTPSYAVARTLLRDATTRTCLRGGVARFGHAAGGGFVGAARDGSAAIVRRPPPSSSFPSPSCLFDRRLRRLSTAAREVEVPPSKNIIDGRVNDGATSDEDPPPRQKTSMVKISEVLKRKHTLRWVEPVISADATVREAISLCIRRKLNGMMVVDRDPRPNPNRTLTERQKCVGLITSRDILRIMADSIKDGKTAEEVLGQGIREQMTPIDQVIYGRPDETIGQCRAIMAKLGIKCLPILSEGRVEGVLAARDFSDFYFDAKDRGGKQNYLRDVSERVGLTTDTSMAEPPVFVRRHLASKHAPLYLNVGTGELPHPFKGEHGVGSSRRNFGPQDLATDPALSEDAHFLSEVELLDETGTKLQKLLYMGVADGVGSWREYSVDPRDFSHKLMGECENVLAEASSQCSLHGDKASCSMISPAELLAQSYKRTKEANVIGSSTACVAVFDSVRHQLHFSNIGDSGIVVLRHIDSEIASALQRDKTTPRAERKSDLRVAFVSQQQLKSFNHPYQLGWTGEDVVEKNSSFRQASDACTSSVHILRGDIVIMATDGLFDNVDVEDIAAVALQWEQEAGFIDGVGGTAARDRRWDRGDSLTDVSARSIPRLAEILCERARENSLDNTVDSPFAMLAKENDIMWSGGMPDDCTVIAMHVVGKHSNAFSP